MTILNPSHIFEGPSSPTLWNLNSAELLDKQAESHGEQEAIISKWQHICWTYADLRTESRRLARRLVERGVGRGDRVVVLAGNSIEFVELFFATTAIGAIFVVINATFTADEVVEAVEFVEPRIVVVVKQLGFRNNVALLSTLRQQNLIAKASDGNVFGLFGIGQFAFDEQGIESFENLKKYDGYRHHIQDLGVFWGVSKPEDACYISFTSGTTGRRKASVLSHNNLINNARFIGDRLDLTEQDILCCPPPLSHCFGLVSGLLATATHGSALVLPSEVFNPISTLQSLTEFRCTAIHAVPTMFESILKAQKSDKIPSQYCLRTGIIAGSSLSADMLQRIELHLNLTGLLYAFGMTELSAVSFMTTLKHSLLRDHSRVGTLLPHTSAKVINDSGCSSGPGSIGELCISGYLVHQEYYKNPEKTAEVIHHDEEGRKWFHTGDLASIDSSGLCTVRGRSKDLIKKGGENIIPQDIEDALLSNDGISSVAVVGVKNERWGEVICCFWKQTIASNVLTDRDLKLWLRKCGTAPYKMPDHYFQLGLGLGDGIPASLPVNATGKVLKAELRVAAERIVARRALVC